MREYVRTRKSDLVVGAVLLLLFLVPLITNAPVEYLQSLVGENYGRSALVFVGLMTLSTVVAPIAVPLAVPAAAPFLGAWQTALLAIVGWSVGAAVAFFLARRYGRPLIERLIDPTRLERFENLLPEQGLFLWMLVSRMLVPVDVLSYALGVVAKVRFIPYIFATVLGIAPFAFIFSYAGDALILREYGRVVGFVGLGAILLLIGWMLLRLLRR